MINRAAVPSQPVLRRAARRAIGLVLAACLTLAPVADAAAQSRGGLIRDAEIEATLRAYADPIFAAAGLKRPDISILDESFLAEVRGLPQRNLAVELLRKLLAGEIKSRGRSNVVQARSFADLLEAAIRRYQNRAVETAQVIEELIELARQMREARERGIRLVAPPAEARRLLAQGGDLVHGAPLRGPPRGE